MKLRTKDFFCFNYYLIFLILSCVFILISGSSLGFALHELTGSIDLMNLIITDAVIIGISLFVLLFSIFSIVRLNMMTKKDYYVHPCKLIGVSCRVFTETITIEVYGKEYQVKPRMMYAAYRDFALNSKKRIKYCVEINDKYYLLNYSSETTIIAIDQRRLLKNSTISK